MLALYAHNENYPAQNVRTIQCIMQLRRVKIYLKSGEC